MNRQLGSHLSAETLLLIGEAERDKVWISGLDGGQRELVLRFWGLFLGPAETTLGQGRTTIGLSLGTEHTKRGQVSASINVFCVVLRAVF